MKRHTSSQARERFSDILDAAERGEEVVIERRGVRYVLRAEGRRPAQKRRRPLIEYVHPAVAAGQWTWELGPDGLEFTARRRE